VAIARRAIDRDAVVHELLAERVDILHAVSEVAEIASAVIRAFVPIVRELDHRRFTFTREFDVFGNAGGSLDTWIVAGVGNVFVDPLLDATTLVPTSCSPTIDTGNPALGFASEAAPNGGRVNMGHTGNTAQAASSLADPNGDGVVDGVDVVRLSVAFGSMVGQARYNAATDFDTSGQVDGTDLAFLAGDFGEICP